MGDSGLTSAAAARGERWLAAVETLALLALGAVLMNYFYAASVRTPGGEVGAPEYDSFYHIRMAALLLERGILTEFPWLRFVYFREQGDAFVSHHFGFHVLLAPFVYVSQQLTGDALAGGRWATSAFFGANLALFNLLLRAARVPHRALWIALFLLLPDQFLSRHGYVRAIGASLMFMQLLILMLSLRRYFWAALVLAAYVHLYLGAVMFGPLIVALFALAQVAGPRGDREIPWRMTIICASGWLLGVLTYPYVGGMWEFLKLQVFGTGLSPDISVGREWLPYTDPWFLFRMAATVFCVWTAVLCVRARFGPPLDARETALLLLQFAFLLLTLKARRFIEYWPPLCLLSAAFMAAPPLRAIAESWRQSSELVRAALPIGLLAAGVALLMQANGNDERSRVLIAEWRAFVPLIGLLLVIPLTRIWLLDEGGTPRATYTPTRLAAPALLSIAFCVVLGLLALRALGPDGPAGRLRIPSAGWMAAAALVFAVPLLTRALAGARAPSAATAVPRTATVLAGALVLVAGVAAGGNRAFADVASTLRCNYDLADIRAAMDYLKEHSKPGDVVFTDDWDVFPVYFYHNTHNHYIVGLDPKFTHQRRPDLWERYVKISRGQTPATVRVNMPAHNSQTVSEQNIPVELSDIREHFGARFVIADRDHTRLSAALAEAPELAELVFPAGGYEKNRSKPYLIFRVRDANEAKPAPPKPDADGRLALSALRPVRVEQGWGDLRFDRSVDGNLMRVRGKLYRRGLGTHAPSRIEFEVPAGATEFQAGAGIDDESGGNGSVRVRVLLDGAVAYESPEIRGNQPAALIKLPLGTARQLTLEADTTSDGKSSDHVDWVDAYFVIPSAASAPASRS